MTDTLLQLDQVTRTYALPRERLWGPPPQVLFSQAAHPYTRALIAAVPRLAPSITPGQRKRNPLVNARPHGATACPYAPRCQQAQAVCETQRPELTSLAQGHQVACHFATTVATAP